ncbi:MAG TPA: RNA methyltransferase [Acidobacteriaceae bacterium]|nr:RNA methyltransferase [Acidobacteriaceae bacterium]
MLPPHQRDCLDVLLVSPRNPLNIGAAARAMANFGFSRLSIVAPFANNWMEAKSAVGAPDLLRHAQVFDTLAEAVRSATLVLGTGSLDRRRPEQALLGLPEGAALIRQSLAVAESPEAAPPRQAPRVALLFGSEKHGLTSDDLAWCHGLITIETSEAQPSMNLGQSVAVILYEISRLEAASDSSAPSAPTAGSHLAVQGIRSGCGAPRQTAPLSSPIAASIPADALPASEHLDRLAELIEETMAAVNYQTRGLRSANGHALRILLRRLMPRDADLRRIMGLFRRILWRLHHQSAQK